MLTTGVIKQVIISNNKAIYKVRLPLFETAGQKKEFIAPCNVCYAPGNVNFYQEGDKVYVDFLCNSYSSPIIIGKIYQGQEETATNSSFNSTLEVTKTAKLPQNTSFGTLTVSDIENMRKQIEQYSDQFNIVNNSINNINTDIEDVTETVETLSETVEDLQEAVENIDTATSTNQGLVKLGSDTVQSSAAVTPSSTSNRTYAVQLNNEGQMVVNVPWEGGGGGGGGEYTIATYGEDGLVRPAYSTTGMATFTTSPAGFSNSPTVEARTDVSGRYYAVEMDATGRMYVNVPWTDKVYYYVGTEYGECYSIDAPNDDYSIQIGDSGFTVDTLTPGEGHEFNILKINDTTLGWWSDDGGSFVVTKTTLTWNNTAIIPVASYSSGLQISSGSVSLYVPVDNALDDSSSNPVQNLVIKSALDNKQDKITSTNKLSYNLLSDTPTIPTKSSLGLDNVDNTSDLDKPISTATQTALNGKQATIDSNNKLSASYISGLANVATSGSYNDLSNLPTIPAAQIQSDWNQTTSTAKDYIKNKPTSQTAVSGGTDISFVTTGEKYTWNNKQDTLISGTNIKTLNNNSILGSGNLTLSSSAITTASMVASVANLHSIFNTFIRGWVVPSVLTGVTYNVFLERDETHNELQTDSSPYFGTGSDYRKTITYTFTDVELDLSELTITASASALNVTSTVGTPSKSGTTVTVSVDYVTTNASLPPSNNVNCRLRYPGDCKAYYIDDNNTKTVVSASKSITVMYF